MKVTVFCEYCDGVLHLTSRRSPVCLNGSCPAVSQTAQRDELLAAGSPWQVDPDRFTGPGRLENSR